MLPDRPAPRSVVAATLLALVAAVSSGPPVVAAPLVSFRLELGSAELGGHAPASTKVHLEWRDQSGALKLRAVAQADTNGFWAADSYAEDVIEAGDTVRAVVGSTARKITVPLVTARLNRVTDIISGVAPASSTLHTFLDYTDVPIAVGANGRYSKDLSSLTDIEGSASIEVELRRGADVFSATGIAGFIQVWVGRSLVLGIVPADATGRIRILTAGEVRGSLAVAYSSESHGWFLGHVHDADGAPIRVQAGDTLAAATVASDASFTIPPVTLAANAATDVITGWCPAGTDWSLEVDRGDANLYRDRGVSGGTITRDISSDANLAADDVIGLDCTLATGDMVSRRFVVE